MAKIKKRGEAGAAKNYITRNQALKKLQLTLADFRRLCILKGIHPRAPRHAKRANKGSTAPASFYYAKDIAFLAHEPVLQTLRAHKAFAKKLSRAVGRQEWGLAKGLQESKPVARLDHIIRERYPTFDDSLRDLDDALSLLTLFAALPASDHVAAALVAKCARIVAEWQLYVVRAQALRKVFLSIKGVYFQAEVRGQTITWLVPYLFTQHVSRVGCARCCAELVQMRCCAGAAVLYERRCAVACCSVWLPCRRCVSIRAADTPHRCRKTSTSAS
jgi:pescadillo protein